MLRPPLHWDRLTVGAGVVYAVLVSVPLMWSLPELSPLYLICVALIASPLVFRHYLNLRGACLLVTILLVPMAVFGFFFALYVYLPVAVPLVAAVLPVPPRRPWRKPAAVGAALVVMLACLVLAAR
ncbi:hypothetical protein [Dactylosporangium matsuzakiense]|uniref:Uncharacterized protein n=1 Tax=Dactylosporangium matsuzakiense TaxID=53360 RepID=A0A9W6NRD1_9ACTN|nr:hypothetical protein [Dactylosporangium matsuzakiense]UWZ42602.1 hypothetical protein Dmats_34280 [Dactylosporangium matsuzakiense]GLL06161.1 hypothetical protein GCM10017581_079090 [Dactylosporangium matsuzakiense]